MERATRRSIDGVSHERQQTSPATFACRVTTIVPCALLTHNVPIDRNQDFTSVTTRRESTSRGHSIKTLSDTAIPGASAKPRQDGA